MKDRHSKRKGLQIPIASAMSTRKPSKLANQTGRTRSGLLAMFNSVSCVQRASAGGKAVRRFPDISSARRVCAILGKV